MKKQNKNEIFYRVQSLTGLELIAEKEKWSICKAVDDLINGTGKELSTISDEELVKFINEKLGRE